MNPRLKQFEKLYCAEIPRALAKVSRDRTLYAAICPHFGWGFELEDRIDWAMSLWTLDADDIKRIRTQESDCSAQFRRLFSWADHVDRSPVSIDSAELLSLVTEWYQIQDDAEGEQEYIDGMGRVIASVCRKLNSRGWNDSRLNKGFVVYTECCDDELANYGLDECVDPKWRSIMETKYRIKLRALTTRPERSG
ncbi:hypothetical protein [Mariniblastus fucicola]|uniref:Uncharacterized protein n=1 Tax=Mariniblastus fucicola TaxID=980251 RepID=A0A5B9P7S9_9BACT|nr:hypothetical protein [Mariniblastus fucicola]QEG22707.1 hypothetical protein MFFC18_25900 [Mariniblastus fucicola]